MNCDHPTYALDELAECPECGLPACPECGGYRGRHRECTEPPDETGEPDNYPRDAQERMMEARRYK
jgi:hypothetical protein